MSQSSKINPREVLLSILLAHFKKNISESVFDIEGLTSTALDDKI